MNQIAYKYSYRDAKVDIYAPHSIQIFNIYKSNFLIHTQYCPTIKTTKLSPKRENILHLEDDSFIQHIPNNTKFIKPSFNYYKLQQVRITTKELFYYV